MELRQLRSFLLVAEHLNFHRAAEALSLSQPALSRQIQQLEVEMECLLLNRTKKKVELTTAGKYLQRHGRKLLSASEQLVGEVKQAWKHGSETLSIGYTEAVMAGVLPHFLKDIRGTHPDVNLRLRPGHSEGLERELARGDLDAALVSLPAHSEDLAQTKISEEKIGVVLPEDHILSKQRSLTLQQLKDEAFILFPYRDNPRLYSDILQACQQAGFIPRRVEEADSRILAVNMAAAGMGIALLSEQLAHYCGAGTVFRSLQKPRPVIHFYLLSPQNDPHPLIKEIRNRI
ncbi:MAG: LysR family transcriptional regulator [Verrucomicrobiota bacterium]